MELYKIRNLEEYRKLDSSATGSERWDTREIEWDAEYYGLTPDEFIDKYLEKTADDRNYIVLTSNYFGTFRLCEAENECNEWYFDEEDAGIQCEEDSEVWELGWEEKVYSYIEKTFDVKREQVEIYD